MSLVLGVAVSGEVGCGVVGKRATLVHPNTAGHENVAHHVERVIRIALLERCPNPTPEPRNPRGSAARGSAIPSVADDGAGAGLGRGLA
ncbi:hypothetical protein MBT42_00330 [Streptomyces sp. MBT42]|nr:hypothetical protein [Streptomyces sp. MBT42]MCD2462004.1 hypothetical protein [Streptomyces sp. MBT42]